MKKVLDFLKIQKYLVLILVALTTLVVFVTIRNREDHKEKIRDQVKALETNNPIKENVVLEVGSILPEIKDYFKDNFTVSNNATIKYYLDNVEVKEEDICKTQGKKCIINQLKTYKVVINSDGEYESSLIIVDKTPPEVTTKEVKIFTGDNYYPKDFIKTYSDNSDSKEYTVKYSDENQAKLTDVGTTAIKLIVCDESNNCVIVDGRLVIEKQQSNPKTETQTKPKTTTTTKPKVTPTKPTKPSSGGSSGSGSSGGSSGSGGSTTPKTCTVQDKTEKLIIKQVKHYGTQENTYVNVTYHVDQTCKKTEVSRTEQKFEVVYSTFNGTVKQMKSEAISAYNSQSGIRSTILNITNGYRDEVNAGHLTIDYNLSIIATLRAMEMAYSNKFSHTRPNGKQWYTIWDDYGLAKAQIIGENLGKGYSTPEGVCKGWKKSPTHYENLVNTRFKKIGIGKFAYQGTTYWAQEFSS